MLNKMSLVRYQLHWGFIGIRLIQGLEFKAQSFCKNGSLKWLFKFIGKSLENIDS